MKNLLRTRSLLAVAIISLNANNALSESQPTSSTSTPPLEEVTVTATKRSVNAQDVAIALSVYSPDSLNDMGTTDIRDLGYIASGLEVRGGATGMDPYIAIRGVGTRATAPANAPTNTIHVDEVPFSRVQYVNFPLFDLERVEILKGPQGTLFGLNSSSGAVNAITKKPTQEADGYLKTRFGNYNEVDLEGAYGMGITDTTAVRVAFKYRTREGYQTSLGTTQIPDDLELFPGLPAIPEIGRDSSYGDVDRIAVRTSLTSKPTENIDLFVGAGYYTDESEIPLREGVNFAGEPLINRYGILTGTDKPFVAAHDKLDPNHDHTQWYLTFRADIDVGFATLTNLTSINDVNRSSPDNKDAQALTVIDQTQIADDRQFSQELRLVSQSDGPLQWTTGVFFLQDNLDAIVDTPAIHLYDPTSEVGQATPGGIFFTDYTEDVSHISVFGEANYEINEHWSIVAGLRYIEEERQYAVDAFDPNPYGNSAFTVEFNGVGPLFPDIPLTATPKTNQSDVVHRFSLEYRPTENILLWYTNSTGKSSGGFDGSGLTTLAESVPYDGEELLSNEVGLKIDWPSANLRFNASYFQYDYEGMQISLLDPITNFVAIVNAGEAEITGAEFDILWKPTQYFSLEANAIWLDSEIQKFDQDPTVIGNVLPESPELTYRISPKVYIPINNSYELSLSMSYVYRDEAFTRVVNEDPAFLIDDYSLLSAKMDFRPLDGNWTFSLWGRNLTDELYDIQRDSQFGNNFDAVVTRGVPRTYGIELLYDF